MNTRTFLALLVAVLLLGGGVGGGIIGVAALSNGGGNNAPAVTSPTRPPPTETRVPSNELEAPTAAQPSDQLLASEPDQEASTEPPEQSEGQIGDGPGGAGFGERGGLRGTVEKIEGGTLTISTQQGLLQAIVGPDTRIQAFAQGTIADLGTGMRVTVVGQRGENGAVEARSVVITPEDGSGFFGRGFAGADQQASPEELSELRRRFQSGEVTQEELVQLRERFGGRGGAGGFGGDGASDGRGFGGGGSDLRGGFDGGEGLAGTIENIEGNTITINTTRGPLEATMGADTAIPMFVEGTLADLSTGLLVTVIGQRAEDGTVAAASIVIAPEGLEGLQDGAFPTRGSRTSQ